MSREGAQRAAVGRWGRRMRNVVVGAGNVVCTR